MLDRDFAAVLFDMDGTLISSIGAVERSWTQLAAEFDIGRHDLGDLHGVPAREVLEIVLPDRTPAVRAAALRRIVELELADVDDIEVLAGAAEALTATAPRSAIVTSCTRDLAHARLGATVLVPPAVVVTADDVVLGKPDPAPYLAGAAALGADPADCLVVEDASAGIAAGRAAGATTLALTTTQGATIAGDLVVADMCAVRLTVVAGRLRVALSA